MIEVVRAINVVTWLVLLMMLFPSMWRAVWRGKASGLDRVLAAVWFLSLNRVTFSLASQFAAGEQAALAFNYVFATMGGLAMCFAARSALRGQARD